MLWQILGVCKVQAARCVCKLQLAGLGNLEKMDLNNDFEEDIEDDEKGLKYGGRDGIIFLIDATLPMFQHQEDDDTTPFKTCLECCKTAMLNKIITSQRDLFAIVFFGTSKTENELKAAHVVTFQELSESSADKLKQLEKILDSDDCDDFEAKYGHSEDFLLSDTLWLCQTLFSKSPHKLSTFRILLFTNTSDPHVGDTAKQHQARVRAGDLSQAGIELELLHMGDGFDTALFYKELVQLAAGESGNGFELPNAASSYDELMTRISCVDHKKRALCKVFFHLGNEVTLAVNLFNLVQKTNMPTKTFLDRASNEAVKSVTQFYDMETAEVMIPAEIMKCQTVGDKKIMFRLDETRGLRKMTQPGMELMGFKPASRVKFHHHIKASSFIYPNDSLIKGSRTLFTALLERCVARSVVPICYLTPRQNSTPKLVALLPQLEKMNKKMSTQELPPGFHVIYLPYADNIRKLQLGNNNRASPEQVAKAKEVLKKLNFKYRPSSFDNPKLDVLWSNIEALALEHETPSEVTDYTLPNHALMKQRLGVAANEFLNSVYPVDYDPLVKKKPTYTKRPAEQQGPTMAKVPRTDNISDAEMASLVKENRVSKLTVNQLKSFLASKYVPGLSSKKKDALVDMVEHYING